MRDCVDRSGNRAQDQAVPDPNWKVSVCFCVFLLFAFGGPSYGETVRHDPLLLLDTLHVKQPAPQVP